MGLTHISFILCVAICNYYGIIEARRLLQAKNGKIVGGTEADIESYPYNAYVLLFNGTDYFYCGGSIISKYFILLAAHCLEDIKSVTVRIGSTNSNSGGRTYETSMFTSHHKYDPDSYDFDIAVIKILSGMELGDDAAVVKLVQGGTYIAANIMLNITGWGTTTEGGIGTDLLRVAKVPTVKNKDCQESLGDAVNITPRMFCAGYEEGGIDTCQGDSGGPAVHKNVQYGVISSGIGCARPNTPGIYTSIANRSIRRWIRYHAKV